MSLHISLHMTMHRLVFWGSAKTGASVDAAFDTLVSRAAEFARQQDNRPPRSIVRCVIEEQLIHGVACFKFNLMHIDQDGRAVFVSVGDKLQRQGGYDGYRLQRNAAPHDDSAAERWQRIFELRSQNGIVNIRSCAAGAGLLFVQKARTTSASSLSARPASANPRYPRQTHFDGWEAFELKRRPNDESQRPAYTLHNVFEKRAVRCEGTGFMLADKPESAATFVLRPV